MSTVGALLIVKNEEEKLAECLDSLSTWVDQIVVVDSGSTDSTCEIAKKYTKHVYSHCEWPGFGKQRQVAQSYLTTDWVFAIDADEVVTDELKQSILKETKSTERALFSVNRLSSAFGKQIRYSGWSPDWIVRLYPREMAGYNDALVHEKVIASKDIPKRKLSGYLLHDTYESLHHYSVKTTSYLKAWSDDREGRPSSLSKALLHAFACFIKMYIIKRGFLDGTHGFVLAWLAAHSTFYKYIDLWLRGRKK
ncbi:glycosyltransferase family 2 protein [Marinomonas mediterranea]|jgi:Glycosyltransferases involved in cell wall biogenesis|uniref:Glycosyl transferase family 2 n=1 Tax=Marinomonas mediterranea (strain ATCC 700492 / JCM 21426 / NBRC 103028 / MMB-1) TaxID=717774 RepID=F2K458_MARM1|nr:glycosyltransferase family 2 protein [Marinomonas mediterranea]ADZ92499.1 glycosyl transferase family 2 [Marinomonas mediterranea MMB-1]WCN10445.1 glycosyltransferase [Marinomonas mediterranea]WCN14493.1 glycosyltransferase [Marinomonas mediterranea]WCN18544.1 glycosyltransferase [Marinomonas mediterranea MMB-1]